MIYSPYYFYISGENSTHNIPTHVNALYDTFGFVLFKNGNTKLIN